MEIKLSVEETQAILNYLGTKPYAEVYQIVALLVSRMPKQEPKQDEDEGAKPGSADRKA